MTNIHFLFGGAKYLFAFANIKHFYEICTSSAQRLRRWSNIVQMLYKCFVFAELAYIIFDIFPGDRTEGISQP